MPSPDRYSCVHFRALVQAKKHGRSVRQIERDADLGENRIAHYHGRTRPLQEPPRLTVCETIARALCYWEGGVCVDEVTCTDVWYAFAQDAGLLPPAHTLSEQQILREQTIEQCGYAEIVDRLIAPFVSGSASRVS